MSFRKRRSVTPLFSVLLVALIATTAAVSAQTRTSVATTSIDFGILGRGGSGERNVALINRAANNSTVRYSIAFTNVTNASGQLTATPSRGEIGPKSTMNVAVRLDVPSNAAEGNYNSSMVINESTVPSGGGNSTALPAVVWQALYTIQGNAPVQGSAEAHGALSNVDVPLVAGVLGVATLVAIAAIYIIFKRT
jgi:hypothetical protein